MTDAAFEARRHLREVNRIASLASQMATGYIIGRNYSADSGYQAGRWTKAVAAARKRYPALIKSSPLDALRLFADIVSAVNAMHEARTSKRDLGQTFSMDHEHRLTGR
jgi:hypothetical protein